MSVDTASLTTHLVGAGAKLIGGLGEVLVRAVSGAFKSSEELRAALLEKTGEFYAFTKPGGEMDQREASAAKKTDDAIAAEEERARREADGRTAPNPVRLADVPSREEEPTKP